MERLKIMRLYFTFVPYKLYVRSVTLHKGRLCLTFLQTRLWAAVTTKNTRISNRLANTKLV